MSETWERIVVTPDEFERAVAKRIRGTFQRNVFNEDPDYDDMDKRIAALARNVLYEHVFDERAPTQQPNGGNEG